MIKAVIVDDEEQVVRDLEGLLGLYCANVEVVAKAYSTEQARKILHESKPDLVFMDIRLDKGSGFDLLRSLESWDFDVIFVTAYNEYAIEAFKFNAIDYLLKPVDSEELINAIERTTNEMHRANFQNKMTHLIESFEHSEKPFDKIILSDVENLYVVKLSDIMWCEASGSYTKFHLQDGQELLVSRHLKAYEKLLSKQYFRRVHRSYLINIHYIIRYNKSESQLILEGDFPIPVSIKSEELSSILAGV